MPPAATPAGVAAPPAPKSFFGRSGPLGRALGGEFEYRAGQVEMAEAVAEALAARRHLLIEAGTGTGKTMAYLYPALASRRRVVVSTGTKNLQDQLVGKDIPLLERALGRKLDVVCVKGRGNYACRQKVAEFARQPALLSLPDLEWHGRIRAWAQASESGERSELEDLPDDLPLWDRLSARKETCVGQRCPAYDACFLTALHRRAAAAELVVVNHHLLFADLTLKRRDLPGVLPPYDALVLDEAHEIEDVAGLYFGQTLSTFQLLELEHDAEAAARQKLPPEGAWLTQLRQGCAGAHDLLQLLWAPDEAARAEEETRPGRFPFSGRDAFARRHEELITRLRGQLAAAAAALGAQKVGGAEADALRRRLAEVEERIRALLLDEARGAVHWRERRGRGVVLGSTPIAVAGLLREHLFTPVDTVVLASATLAVGGGFAYARARLGVDHGGERIVPSSFDFRRQTLLYIPPDLPDPRAEEFAPAAADEIAQLLECSRGRAFVLFTSHEQMRAQHRRLAARLPFPVLLQGEAPRARLLEKFRSTPNAVLFATSSFWRGVDVQGEQLSCVIIDRLPFASPGDPVLAARLEARAREGGNPFLDLQVPQAVLALKQGFGRLIRSRRDRGVLALLDGRVLRQRYGQIFLASLPPYQRAESLADVRRFFAAA